MLYKKTVLLIGAFLMFINFGFSQKEVLDKKFDKMLQKLLSHSVNEVVPSDINDPSEVLFLDAREIEEFEVSHLPNAKWIGYDTFKPSNVNGIDKNSKIVVYCTVGYRSEKITEKLQKQGFTNVSNLYGGIFEWVHSGNSVTNNKGETRKIHTYDSSWAKWLTTGEKVH